MPRRSKVEELKNLKVSETVDGSANLEILRVAQDDKAGGAISVFASSLAWALWSLNRICAQKKCARPSGPAHLYIIVYISYT